MRALGALLLVVACRSASSEPAPVASAKAETPLSAHPTPSIVRLPSPADDPQLRALEEMIADGGAPMFEPHAPPSPSAKKH